MATAVRATQQLSGGELEALAALEKRAVSADGGRLKLEWGSLRNRPGNVTRDFTWWDDEELVGFLGLYAFGGAKIEIAGMVDPGSRRRGIATALLEAARPVCRQRGDQTALLVVPRNSRAGREFALQHAGVLEHSEHAMLMRQPPDVPVPDSGVELRLAARADFAAVSALFEAGFGHPAGSVDELVVTDRSRTVVIEHAGELIGVVRLSQEGERGGVYGFTIAPHMRGRGIGRDVLARVCRQLFDAGMTHVGLEVAVENDHALGLYLSLGFVQVATEDYYELPL